MRFNFSKGRVPAPDLFWLLELDLVLWSLKDVLRRTVCYVIRIHVHVHVYSVYYVYSTPHNQTKFLSFVIICS